MGAKPLDSGYFLLPERIARKPIEEVASKERAEYRRRYHVLDELEHTDKETALVTLCVAAGMA